MHMFIAEESRKKCSPESLLWDLLLLLVPFWCFLSIAEGTVAFPFRIFSGEGGTDFDVVDVKPDLTKLAEGAEDEEAEEVVEMVAEVELILTLAPSVFTRLGIFSRLTIGTGTLRE